MSADAGRIWRKVLDQLKQDMSAANFESYFSGTEAEVFADDEMVVSIDNPLTRDTLVARFRQHILRALFDVVGRECRLRLVTDGNGTGSPGPRERADGLVLLSDVRPRAMRYLWKGRIPLRTVTIIGGAPGDGKTTLTDDLAARWTSGREMPDGSRSDLPGGCGVVLLKYEDALAETTRPRLEAFGAALALIVTFDEGEGGAPLPTLGDVERLERAVRTRLDVPIGALIVDPIMAAMPPGLDAYRDQDVRPMLIELIRLAERTNIA
ncbi:MAG: AAA family ATPase, partial [Solirubrobacterales bacterium]